MKKLVLKLDMLDEGGKRKVMKTVAGLSGIDSISIDMKDRKLTIIGTVDPTRVVSRLRKYWTTELLTVGPVVKPEKDEPKKEEEVVGDKKPAAAADNEHKKEGDREGEKKVEEFKKEEGKKEGDDEGGKTNVEAVGGGCGEGAKKVDPVLEMVKAYRAYNPQMTKYYYVQSMEENPNACVVC